MNDGLSPREADRISRTVAAIPPDARSCLEVGFLNLHVTARLADKIDLISIDLPREVKNHRAYRLAFADIQHLPFKDGAFDLAFCTEVLEHLPESILIRGCAELRRVTSKYLLITVPLRQRVWNELFRCRHCGHQCNTMGHLHYFDEARLDGHFPGMRAVKREEIGQVLGYAPDWLYALGRAFGGGLHRAVFDHPTGVCPKCMRTDAAMKPNFAGMLIERIIWRLERIVPRRSAWMLVLYEHIG